MSADDQLLQQVLAGDPAAYAGLVRAHQARILRLCTSLLGDAALAEDAAQDVFFKAYQKLGAFRRQSAFSTWLYRIAANHCLDLLRKQRRQPAESLDALLEAAGDAALPATAERPQEALARVELVRRALSRLSPDYRLILTLRELEGLSYGELAAALDCSLDAVKSRLRRAREELLHQVRHFLKPGRV